ncbi:MAG: tRNA (adenosine(37)-N6)-threonylcarbamoyltransferase complex transferase subunit TsaD [Bacteroidetes Order II. Incertae sedis bacterium]|nr:tRNA (adenosine(37)-N6)-threonylcarbamoyltransferase complex transferase subunit TsaD [Bacteroidetes Order II. bacterium]
MKNADLMINPRVLLAIESSCDDTASAVFVEGEIRSSILSSQEVHSSFGGVVPELASRDHQRRIVPVVEKALEQAGVSRHNVDAIAVTYGPGLAGSLLVGLSFAKAFAMSKSVPFVGVNHMEGHMYSVFLEENPPAFPFLCLTVSGGHTELTIVEEGFRHTRIGKTRDDAAGEAFDKVAKLLDLGYPGGPKIDQLACEGNPTYIRFPRTNLPGYDFSFSGIKTAMLYHLGRMTDEAREIEITQHLADLCASFQAAVIDMLLATTLRAISETGLRQVAVVGGVSANTALRAAINKAGIEHGFSVHIPALKYCMDNAAMIGVTGLLKLRAGITSPLSLNAQPNLSV